MKGRAYFLLGYCGNIMSLSITLKQGAQGLLKQAGLYQRMKASCIYDFYRTLDDPHWIADRNKEVEFFRRLLAGFRAGDLIFDIGANYGAKTDVFLRLGARVVSVDPDETNIEILKGKFLTNRIIPKPVVLEGKAVSDRVGQMTMWVDAPGSALNTLNPKWADTLRNDETRFGRRLNFTQERIVETTTLDYLIARHGRPSYIKIDVEGHELAVLRGLRQPVPCLSFEVNLPDFREESLECVRLLNELNSDGQFNYAIDCRKGLGVERWLPAGKFLTLYQQCEEPAVEIFWRSPAVPHPA